MTDAAPSLDTEAVFIGFTGIQHRPLRKRGGPRSQPYTVWYQGNIVFFCRTKGEAAEALGRVLRRSSLRAGFNERGTPLSRRGLKGARILTVQ